MSGQLSLSNPGSHAREEQTQANHFGVMQVHNLKETMTKKGNKLLDSPLLLVYS